MSRLNLEDIKLYAPTVETKWRLRKMVWVPADNAVLDIDFAPYIELDPAGAVDILMPTSSADIAGMMFLMSNISANTVTLKTDGDAAFTTAISIATLENTIVFCTGSATQAIGWRALATALSS